MSVKLRFIFVQAPQIKDYIREYPLTTSTKQIKQQLYSDYPTEANTTSLPLDYSRLRLILGGQKMDDTKLLSEYPVCNINTSTHNINNNNNVICVHATLLPPSEDKKDKKHTSQNNNRNSNNNNNNQQQQTQGCCVIQ